MDDDDYKYAEFVFQFIKEKPRILASTVAEYTHHFHKKSTIKELHNFDHIFEYLSDLLLISIEFNSTGRGRPQFLKLTSIGEETGSVEARLRKVKFDQYNRQKRLDKEENDRAVEVEYFKRQNWLAKYWWLTASVSAFIGAIAGMLIQKIILC